MVAPSINKRRLSPRPTHLFNNHPVRHTVIKRHYNEEETSRRSAAKQHNFFKSITKPTTADGFRDTSTTTTPHADDFNFLSLPANKSANHRQTIAQTHRRPPQNKTKQQQQYAAAKTQAMTTNIKIRFFFSTTL